MALCVGCAGEPEEPAAVATLFQERALQAGIRFRMGFLPGEQGENFKINFYDHGSGVAVGDCDSDGDDDIYFVNQLGSNALYRNNGDGTFSDITAGPIALPDRICVSALFNDFDSDGDQDLYVTSTRGGNAYFRNEGGGRFTDATAAAGLTLVAHSQGATAFDADGDGDLDLLVTNTAKWTTDDFSSEERYYRGPGGLKKLVESPIEFNVFYRNSGDGTFADATDESGLKGIGWSGDCAVFDHDGDGDSDLFVANMFGSSTLYGSDGKGRFEVVTEAVLGKTPFGTVGSRAFDYDGDGQLDLFVVDMHSDMWMNAEYDPALIEEKKKYAWFFGRKMEDPGFPRQMEEQFASTIRIRYSRVFFGNALYRNTGTGKYEEVSDKANAETFWPWGIAAGDFDNDGFEDVYIPSGMGSPFFYWLSPLLRNNGDGTFRNDPGAAPLDSKVLPERIGGKEAAHSSRSAAVLDYDADGRLDLVVNTFNARALLYRNALREQRNFLALRLRGTRSNRDAIGAVVRIWIGDKVMVRQVQAAGGYLAQSSKSLHFGLGDAAAIDRCEIRWPSGTIQELPAPAPNRLHEVTEP